MEADTADTTVDHHTTAMVDAATVTVATDTDVAMDITRFEC